MDISGLGHIGIAVTSLEKALWFYRDVLGLQLVSDQEVPNYGVRAVFLEREGLRIELMESIDQDGVIARFLAERGAGVQHVAVRVPDIDSAIREIAGKGGWVVEDTRGLGGRGEEVVFIHPASTGGVVIELIEE